MLEGTAVDKTRTAYTANLHASERGGRTNSHRRWMVEQRCRAEAVGVAGHASGSGERRNDLWTGTKHNFPNGVEARIGNE